MDVNHDTVSIVVGIGGRINMLTEEQANRLLSGGSIMSGEHISVMSSAQESRSENALAAVATADGGHEVAMGGGADAGAAQGNHLQQSLGCLTTDGGLLGKEMRVDAGTDPMQTENLRVIVQEEGEDLRCLVDADGNKIDVAIEGQQAINAGDMVQVYLRDSGGTVALVKEESSGYCLQATNIDGEVMECNKTNMATDPDNTTAPSPEHSESNNTSSNNNNNNNSSSKTGSNSQLYKCPMCTYSSIYKNNYHRHVAKHNSDQELLHCRRCSFNTIYKHSLKRHMLTHPEEKGGAAAAAADPTAATNASSNPGHNASAAAVSASFQAEGFSVCDLCPYKTKNSQHLKRHLQRHSNEKVLKTFTCDSCGYTSKYKQHYERHLLKHSGKKTYKCNSCDYATPYIDNYKRHCIKHSKEKSFTCDQCSYTSAYPDNYKRHMLKHSGEKSFFCPHCSYASAYSDNFERHLLKHSNGKIYSCTTCNYRSAYVDNYKRHLLKHSRDKLHTCQYCNYSTVYIDNYRRHVTVHTGEGAQTCPHCNYSTTIKYKFKQHMSLHTGHGLIQCPYCPYKTPRKYQFKRHLSIHTQEGRYNCTICSHSTAYKSSHRKHMHKHGKEPDFDAEGGGGRTAENGGGLVGEDSQNGGPGGAPVSIGPMQDQSYSNPGSVAGTSSAKVSEISKIDVITREQMSLSPSTTGVSPLPTRSIRQIKSKKNTLARVCVANTNTVTSVTESSKKPLESSQSEENLSIGVLSSGNSMNGDSSSSTMFSAKIRDDSITTTSSGSIQTARVAPVTRAVPHQQQQQQQQLQQQQMQQHQLIPHLQEPTLQLVQDLASGGQSLMVNRMGLDGVTTSVVEDLAPPRHALVSTHSLAGGGQLLTTPQSLASVQDLASSQHLTTPQNLTIAGLGSQQDNGRPLQELSVLPGAIFCAGSGTQDLTSLTVQDLSGLGNIQQQALPSRQAVTYSVQNLTSTGLNLTSNSTTARSVASSMSADELLGDNLDSTLSSITSASSTCQASILTSSLGSNPSNLSHSSSLITTSGGSNPSSTRIGSNHASVMVSDPSSSMEMVHRSAVPSGHTHMSAAPSTVMSAVQPGVSAALHASLPSSLQQTLAAGQVIASTGGQSFLLTTPTGALQGREFTTGQYFTPATFTGHPSHITFTAHLPPHITAQLQHVGGGVPSATSAPGNIVTTSPHMATTSSLPTVVPQTIAFVQHAVSTYDGSENDNGG